jgi:hypothetical protein
MELIAPVAGLFLEERLNLPDGGLSQVNDIHGRAEKSATPAARVLS